MPEIASEHWLSLANQKRQCRTRAAVEAGRTSIPVMIIESPEEAERIVTQVVENIQRAELTEVDEADACHQLSMAIYESVR